MLPPSTGHIGREWRCESEDEASFCGHEDKRRRYPLNLEGSGSGPERRPVPQRFCLGVEALLPFLVVVQSLANEGSEEGDAHEQPIQQIGREAQRLDEIDEQDDARLAGVVPGFMDIGIVEDEGLALL